MSWNNVIPGWIAIEMFQDDPDIQNGMKRAVCILITRQTKEGAFEVLAVSRKNDPNAFGLPGGKVEADEPRLRAAVRELEEETGLVVEQRDMNPVFKHTEIDYVTTTFMPTRYTGEARTRKGEGVVAWVSPETLVNGPFGQYNRQLFAKMKIPFKV